MCPRGSENRRRMWGSGTDLGGDVPLSSCDLSYLSKSNSYRIDRCIQFLAS